MSIMELGALGEFVGSIGVIATLVYLAIQIRQNTSSTDESRRLAMAQAYQTRAEIVIGINLQGATTPELRELYVKMGDAQGGFGLDPGNLGTLTDDERTMLLWYENAKLTMVDNAFYQHQQGFLDDEYFESVIVPRIRSWAPTWRTIGMLDILPPSFVTAIDHVLSKES